MGIITKTASKIMHELQAVLKRRQRADTDEVDQTEPEYVIVVPLEQLLREYVHVPEMADDAVSTPSRRASRASLAFAPALSPIKEVESPGPPHNARVRAYARSRPSMPILRYSESNHPPKSAVNRPAEMLRSSSTPCLVSDSWLDARWEERVRAPCFGSDDFGLVE